MPDSQENIGILTTDTNLVVRTWDAWLARVTGIPADQAVDRPLNALVPDLEERGRLARLESVLREGAPQVLAPALHQYLIPCRPQSPSDHFQWMQQHVTIAPLHEEDRVVGLLITIRDVTARHEQERLLNGPHASPDEETRLLAAQQLAAGDAEEATEALAAALGDESWRVRRAATRGLAQRGGAAAVAAFLRGLHDAHHNLSILNSALQGLAVSDLDVVTPLVQFLNAAEVDLRVYAALALGERRDPRAIPALIDALKDPDSNVQYHAIEALGRLRAREAVPELVAIAEARDFFLAFPALDALTQIGAPNAAPRIVPLLADELLQPAAVDALARLGDEKVVRPLADLLNQPGAPSVAVASALASVYERYEAQLGEGGHIADLARRSLTPTAARNLLDAVAHARPDELVGLARVLGWLEGPAVERALTRLLGDPNARGEVVRALVRYGPRVTDLLIEQLAAPDLETRQAAVVALGRIGDREAVPALIQSLSQQPELLVDIAGALGMIGDRRAFEPLLQLLGDPKAVVRLAAISALNSLGHPDMPKHVASLLTSSDPHKRESAVRIAGYFGYDECLDLLFERCQDSDENVRRAALESIAHLEDARVVPTLLDALTNGPPRVRAIAARGLGRVDDQPVLGPLMAALQDDDVWVRYYAATALGHLAPPDAVDILGELARNDPVPMVRAAALKALGAIGGARAVAFVAPHIEASEQDVWRAALEALGQMAHPDALPPLLDAVRSPDPGRRLTAIRALAQRDDRGAAGALQWVAAVDDDPAIAGAAIEALARLATPQSVAALTALTAEPARREASIAALAGLGRDHVEEVAGGLSHIHPAVRRATVQALSRIKAPSASVHLERALADSDSSVRLEAVLALQRLGRGSTGQALRHLAEADPDPGVRQAAGGRVA